jgi:uncharacterized membrane protein
VIKVADALNSFASEPEASAPPSEEIFVLTSGQLQDLICEAVARAQAPLLERLEAAEAQLGALQARLDALEEERGAGSGVGERTPQDAQEGLNHIFQVVLDLKASLESLEDMTARERAYDRQRLARLERVDPQPLQKDRGEILRALIAANGGKMLATDARKKMHLSRSRFSKLLATVKDEIEARPYHLNKSWQVLVLR